MVRIEKVLIIGPRRLQNQLLADYIATHFALAVDSGSALPPLRETEPQAPCLILCDCGDRDDQRLLRELRPLISAGHPQDLWLLLNLTPTGDIERRMVELGVRGFFYERDGLELLTKGIRSILDGELWMPRKKMERCLLTPGAPELGDAATLLTARERDILRMLTTGANNERIGERLGISPHTVKTHIYNIFKKIKVTNRLEAAIWATQQGLADTEA